MEAPQQHLRVDLLPEPDGPAPPRRYEITRPGPSGSLKGIILSDAVTYVKTHWYRGRTRPHTKPWCAACEAKTPFRWHAYFFKLDRSAREITLVQLTDLTRGQFKRYAAEYGSMRGCIIQMSRKRPEKNGQVIVRITRGDWSPNELPACPDLNVQLSRIWSRGFDLEASFDPNGPSEPPTIEYGEPTQRGLELGEPGDHQ